MYRITLLVCLAMSGSGCGADKPSKPPPAACAGVCFDDAVAQRLADVKKALAACKPAESHDPAEPGSLKISEVTIAKTDGDRYWLRVSLANTSGKGAMDYPGILLRVDKGAGALVDPGDGTIGGPNFDHNIFYGAVACHEQPVTFVVQWDGKAALHLTAVATNSSGAKVEDEVAFRLEPAK